MERRALFLCLLSLILIGAIVCTSGIAASRKAGNPLVVYPSAKGVQRSGKIGESEHLSYHVAVSYPATNVIDLISGKLQRAGWKPLAYNYFDPKTYAAGMRKWGYYLESLKHPDVCIHTWIGDWKDDSGDVVRYMFLYRGRGCGTSDLTEIKVIGLYVPAAAARQMRATVQRLRDESRRRQ